MKKREKRDVIIVTDGDQVAQKAVQQAALNVGGRCISRSGGNPTPLTGEQIVEQVMIAKYDPVLVMFDDNGNGDEGDAERAIEVVANHPDINLLGVVAVASNTPMVDGADVDLCVTNQGVITNDSVDKDGIGHHSERSHIYGDTVDVLQRINAPLIVGIGDIGKMQGHDHYSHGAPITTKAVEIILERSGYDVNHNH
jgi:stage V sporulation protein AE